MPRPVLKHSPILSPAKESPPILSISLHLNETIRLQHIGYQKREELQHTIFVAFRRIWSRIDRLLPGRAKPTTIGFTQEIDLWGTVGPPPPSVFAVSASGDTEQRETIRHVRSLPFSELGVETKGKYNGE